MLPACVKEEVMLDFPTAISREIAGGPGRYSFTVHDEQEGDGIGVDDDARAAWNVRGWLKSDSPDGRGSRTCTIKRFHT